MSGALVVSKGTNSSTFGKERTKKSSTLDDLVQSSRNLPKRLDDIETLHLTLNEIQKRALQLRKYNKKGTETNPYTKAHYLLIGKGLTIEDIEDELNTIKNLTHNNEYNKQFNNLTNLDLKPYSRQKASNLESYIYKQKDEDVLLAIEGSLSSAAKDFDNYVNSNVKLDWKKRKAELCDKLSTVLKKEPSSNLSSPEKKMKKLTQKEIIEKQLIWGTHTHKSLISSNFKFSDVESARHLDSIVNPNISYALRKKFELNAEVIYELNEARQQNDWYKLATVFSTLYKSDLSSSKSEPIHEAWVIIREFCESSADNDNQRKPDYRDAIQATLNSFESINFKEVIAQKSKTYLEQQFRDYINELYTINKGSLTNNVAKVEQAEFLTPNVNKVLTFIELTMKTKQKSWKVPNMTFVNGLPLWAILFYLLRAGCFEEAVIFVSRYESSFQKLEKYFPLYLKAYCENNGMKLSQELQGRINNEFNQYFKNSNKDIDPYRYATYKLIGRCDLATKSLPSITLSIEDWLWLHLALLKEDSSEYNDEFSSNNERMTNDTYSLIDLQQNVLEFGPQAFNSSTKNPMYLQTLLLTGLYEDAIKYLMFSNEIDAVHLAIALHYYGLLRIPPEDPDTSFRDNLLSVNINGFKIINFARLIGNYVKSFKFSDPRVAAEYLLLLSLDGSNHSIKLCQDSLRDLVLETREFVLLLGKISKNGMRIPGVIEERKSLIYLREQNEFLYEITERAAQKANEDGRLLDCVLLYQLSEEYDTVLVIINKLLGDFLNSIDLTSNSDFLNDFLNNSDSDNESNIIKLSDNLLKVYNGSPEILSKTSAKNRMNCRKLLDIFKIMKEFLNDADLETNCVTIMDKVKELDLIPIMTENDISKIRNYINEFNNYDESIMKNIPNLLIIEMSCLQKLILSLSYSSMSNDANIYELKQISKNCMIFAGLIKYKMPREVYTLLINLEINI